MIKEDKETIQFMEDCFVISYLLMEITKQTNLSLTEKFYFVLMACNLVKMVETTHTHTHTHKCAQENKADIIKHLSEAKEKNYTYNYIMDTCN